MCSCDAEPAKVWTECDRKARKPYWCEECRAPIAVGAVYRYVTALHDGSWETYRFCLRCAQLGSDFNRVDSDGCWPLGGLIEAVFECDVLPALPPASAGHAAGVMFRWREEERDRRSGRRAA